MTSVGVHPLGKYIRDLRKQRKLKLVQVGRAVNRSAAFICDIEKGLRGKRPNPVMLIKLANYFQVPVNTMFEMGGLATDESNDDYKLYLKVTRNKVRSELMRQRFEVLYELLDELESATVDMPYLLKLVEKTINAGRELQTAIQFGR